MGGCGAAGRDQPAIMQLPAKTLHLPYDGGAYRMALGLTAIPEAGWIEIDAEYPAHLAERRRLLAERPAEVIGALPGTEAVQREALSVLEAHLAAQYPAWFVRGEAGLENRLLGETIGPGVAPLLAMGRLVQEDFCLLRQEPDGGLRLIAAVLCFPSRWRLSAKLGSLLGPIHAPVPFYPDRLARPVDRFLGALAPGRFALRLNWGVMENPALFQPTGHGVNDPIPHVTAANAGETLFLRVERQSFRRLPESGVVVFGIRVHVTPLAEVVARPGEAARLAASVAALPEAMEKYKSMAPFRAALLAYLGK